MIAGARVRETVLFQVQDEHFHVSAFRASSDRARIAYVFAPRGVEAGSLWLHERDSATRTSLALHDHGYWSPSWSPAGRHLAVCSSRTGAGEVWRFDLETGQQTLITALGANVSQVAWSPAGDRFAFLANPSGTYELFLSDLEGITPRKIGGRALWRDPFPAIGPRGGSSFAWHPDGAALICSSSSRLAEDVWHTEIWRVNADTGAMERLFQREARTRDDCALLDMSYSPDARRIAFRRCIGEKFHLLVIDESGHRLLKRKYIGSLADSPWHPDGNRLVCYAEPGLLEIHDLDRARVMRLRESGGLHRFRTPCFETADRLLFSRGAALATLPTPESEESAFDLGPNSAPGPQPELAQRESAAFDLQRVRRDVATLKSQRRPDETVVRAAASHVALQPLAVEWLDALPAPERDRLLLAACEHQDAVALDTAALALTGRPGPPCPQLLDLLGTAVASRRAVPPPTRAALARLLADCRQPLDPGTLDLLLAAEDPGVRAAGVYVALVQDARPMDHLVTEVLRPARAEWVDMGAWDNAVSLGRRHIWRNLSGPKALGAPTALMALRALRRRAAAGASLRPLVEALLHHPDEAVRTWMVHLGAADASILPDEWLEASANDACPAVRSAVISARALRRGAPPAAAAVAGSATGSLVREAYVASDYWELRVDVALRAQTPTAGLTLSMDVADRSEVQELAPHAVGQSTTTGFFFSLALWDAVPGSLPLLIESREGARSTWTVPIEKRVPS